MKIKVLNKEGKETGREVTLPKAYFGVEPNDHAIYLDVKQFQANKRQGTHKAKERSEIRGSRKKLRKQKGSGHARVGDIKNPLFRGGGRVFGPRPRSYSFKLNKKLKSLARKSALAYKAQENKIFVVEDFTMDAPKTAEFSQLLKNLEVNGSSLYVTAELDRNVYLSSRNIPSVKVMKVENINTYDILWGKHLILAEGALNHFK